MNSLPGFRMTLRDWLSLMLILGLGLGLRLYQIGNDLFWLDEVGVALGSVEPTLSHALEVTRSHIMGMPLDYVIAWGVGRFSNSEGLLRLPEAIWGTLSLLAAWLLYREIAPRPTAFLGLFLLALSPLHVRYSQELRFYAPLVFFYTLASWLVLKAIQKESIFIWLLFTLTALIGVLFHVFTVLVLVNALLWAFLSRNRSPALWRPLTISAASIMVFLAVAVIGFGNFPGYSTSLTAYEPFHQFLLGGLGWIPIVPTGIPGWFFHGKCLAASAVGTVLLLRGKSGWQGFAIPLLILLQVCIILCLDIFERYFASSRQLLILLPLSTFLAAVGVTELLERTTARLALSFPRLRLTPGWAGLFISLLFLLASIPTLADYYRAEKTAAPHIIAWLSVHMDEGQTLAVFPDFEERTYSYYLPRWERYGSPTPLASEARWPLPVHPADFDNGYLSADYLITGTITEDEKQKIEGMGYALVFSSPPQVLHPQSIWMKQAPH